MKKLVSLLLTLLVLASATAALADSAWFSNNNGTHFTMLDKTTKISGTCEMAEITYGNTTIRFCPVCNYVEGYNPTWMESMRANAKDSNIRVIPMPADSDVAFVVTLLNPITTKGKYFTLPVDGRSLRILPVYFDSLIGFEGRQVVTPSGLRVYPENYSLNRYMYLLVK